MNAAVKPLAHGADFTFYLIGTEVYRAPSNAKLVWAGVALGARWECSLAHWEHYRQTVFGWATDC